MTDVFPSAQWTRDHPLEAPASTMDRPFKSGSAYQLRSSPSQTVFAGERGPQTQFLSEPGMGLPFDRQFTWLHTTDLGQLVQVDRLTQACQATFRPLDGWGP